MSTEAILELQKSSLSLDHQKLAKVWINTANLLIIQDLDGVCMGLVKDPLNRVIDVEYVKATQAYKDHFYVLTNGEHIGSRGINTIIDKAFQAKENTSAPFYLPGLAAGGVQWQDINGNISHPGVSKKELKFLASVPNLMRTKLTEFFRETKHPLTAEALESYINASILDNYVSPTVNLNTFYEKLAGEIEVYQALQERMLELMEELQEKAKDIGLTNAFFYHLAPNLGRNEQGKEIMKPVTSDNSGTTDFQYMLKGAVKEAGVVAILNFYYGKKTGIYPLGEDFNARQAPSKHEELLRLVTENFDQELMPTMIGVGDTVNSSVEVINGEKQVRRGGSDRNFLQLIQDIGKELQRPNLVVYIDSSQGEVKNRKPLIIKDNQVIEGPGDIQDTTEPLQINVVFPGGYQQYCQFFCEAAKQRLQ